MRLETEVVSDVKHRPKGVRIKHRVGENSVKMYDNIKPCPRAIDPHAPTDAALLTAISRGEFTLNGFRNRDLRTLLFNLASASKSERHRQAAVVSRKLLLLRAHHLIRKVPRTHRYLLTKAGRIAVTALIGDGAHVLNVGEIADHCGFSPWNCRKRRIGARLIAPCTTTRWPVSTSTARPSNPVRSRTSDEGPRHRISPTSVDGPPIADHHRAANG